MRTREVAQIFTQTFQSDVVIVIGRLIKRILFVHQRQPLKASVGKQLVFLPLAVFRSVRHGGFFRLALQFFFHLLVRKSRAGNLQLRNFLLFRRQARVLPLQFRNLFQKIFVARHRLFKPYDFSDTDTDQEENSHPDG